MIIYINNYKMSNILLKCVSSISDWKKKLGPKLIGLISLLWIDITLLNYEWIGEKSFSWMPIGMKVW